MLVKMLAVDRTLMWNLCKAHRDYPIGVSCNAHGEIWGCLKFGKSKSDATMLLDFPAEVLKYVLRLHPDGGKLILSERIGGVFTVSKCRGRHHSEPIVWITEAAAVGDSGFGLLDDEVA
jgi:hypothetical protein